MRRSHFLAKALLATTALTFIQSASAAAQERGLAIEEIVVTATRRDESILRTPINITAVSSADIDRLRLTDISDIARWSPGLSLVDQGSRGASQLIVRGLSVASLNASEFLNNSNGDTVATYIGDIPVYIDLKPYDLERVEVLLGPQGTLYGAGTLGGAVRYIPKRPDPSAFSSEVHARVYDLAHSSGVGFNGDAIVNIPVIPDRVALRISGGYLKDPGFIDYNYLVRTPGVSDPEPDFTNPAAVAANLTRKKDANDEETISARAALLGKLTDNFEATLSYYYQDIDSGGRQVTHRAAIPEADKYTSAYRFLEPNRRKNNLVGLEINWNFDWAKLTSATGYSRFHERGQRDQTDLLLDFEYGYEQFPSFVAFTREISKEERINQEVRLVSSNESKLTWIVGGFYNSFNLDASSEEFVPGFPQFAGINRPDNLEYIQLTKRSLEEKAAFGEVGYAIMDWWKLTFGGRYYNYHDDESTGFDLPLLGGSPTAININLANNSVGDSGFLFKVNTSFDLSDTVLLYGTVSQGYRIGGVNPVPPCPSPIPPGQNVCALSNELLIKPDKTLNKEIGVKGSAFGGRFVFNAAAYHINWTDIQTQGTTVNGAIPITVNGGKAISQGFELSAQGRITDGLTASATWSYTDAHLTQDAPGLVDGSDAFKGDRVAGSPKHQMSLALDYVYPLANDYSLAFNYGVTYQSNVLTKVGLRNNGEKLPGYDLHNASVTLSKDMWEVSVSADNMFDKFAVSSVRQDRSFIRAVNGFSLRRFHEDVIRPRTIGIEGRYRF
jgi:iron complex outermembrane receptor protein